LLLTEVNNPTENIFEHQPKIIFTRIILLLVLSLWIYGFLLPTITSIDNSISNMLLSRVYSNVCHQENAKCISIGNASMMVCSRCAGIYFGAFTAGLLSLFLIVPSINRRVLILSAIPLGMDVLFVLTAVYTYSQGIASATGLVFGGVVYLFLLNELENLFSKKPSQGNE
jgi:uncharacterized membrane protein